VAPRAGFEGNDLHDLVTLETPLGPHASEGLVTARPEVIAQFYDETNRIHTATRLSNPYFIVGRKGAGKTAFLLGGAVAHGADYVLIASEDVYTEVNKLRFQCAKAYGSVAADSLVHVWEVLLFHAAMLAIVRSNRLPFSTERQSVLAYMSRFGPDPAKVEESNLLASVTAAITKQLLECSEGLSFHDACWSINPGTVSFAEAAQYARTILDTAKPGAVWVVVDNLEDLHVKLDDFSEVVTALFRIPVRSQTQPKNRRLPFRSRFAFPAELLPRLSGLSANPEKDLGQHLIIRWTASELIVVAGNRIRLFLNLHYPQAYRQLGLPARHDPEDAEAAVTTLRAVLPDAIQNRLSGTEDPVAYLMRHTQLLPRHLIMLLNRVLATAVATNDPGAPPRATSKQVVDGVQKTERLIVGGVLTTYSHEFPYIKQALKRFKNQMRMVEPVSSLHHLFNKASLKRTGIDFDEFLDACLAVGALGVVRDGDPHGRYVQGDFSYTFADDVRPREDTDSVCVHPLFISRLFDARRVDEMARAQVRPVYPYGSDPEHEAQDV
jgi:hypothetical protein